VVSVVDRVSCVALPPATGTEYALKMPLWFEENRMRFSSGEKEAPATGRRP